MKTYLLHIISIISLLWGLGDVAMAGNDVTVSDVRMTHDGSYFTVEMLMDLRYLDVDVDLAVLLTPCLKNDADSVELPSVGIYGRRYYFYVRNGESMLTDKEERSYRAKEKPDTLICNKAIDYKEWMNGPPAIWKKRSGKAWSKPPRRLPN